MGYIKKDNHTALPTGKQISVISSILLSYAPIVFVSAKTKQRLNKLPEMIKRIERESKPSRIYRAVLNDVIMDAIAINRTPTDKGNALRFSTGHKFRLNHQQFVIFVTKKSYALLIHAFLGKSKFVRPLALRTPIHLIARVNENAKKKTNQNRIYGLVFGIVRRK